MTDDELPPGGEILDDDPPWDAWRPEVLLFKAKHARPKDEADLRGTLPQLDPAARDWLGWALGRVHPGHRWIEMLEPE